MGCSTEAMATIKQAEGVKWWSNGTRGKHQTNNWGNWKGRRSTSGESLMIVMYRFSCSDRD
jgi:hypothetical protein